MRVQSNFGGIDLISRSSSYTGCKYWSAFSAVSFTNTCVGFFYQICTKSNITSKRNGYTLVTSHLDFLRKLTPALRMSCIDKVLVLSYILVKSSNRPRVFLPIFGKAIRTISISFSFPNRKAYQSSITEKAKQNFVSCIQEPLSNTLTLNFKIHKNLHCMVG